MSAIACLRIAVGEDLAFVDSEHLAASVAKVAGAFLETTWLWPRRFGLVAPFSFVLADPRATRLDARELQELAINLRGKLFGAKGNGDVCLLMLEGDQTEVMRFAGAHLQDLRDLLDGKDDGAFAGRICRITPEAVESLAPPGGPVEGAPPQAVLNALPEPPAPPPGAGWWGLYDLTQDAFVGDALVMADRRGELLPEDDDPFGLERDLVGLRAVIETLPSHPHGLLLTGFGFSSLVRSSMRAALKPELATVPGGDRGRLAACIRNAPREPSYGVLSEVLRLLEPTFGEVDVQVGDPEFRIDCIPAGAFRSVTLVLEGHDERRRLASARRFLEKRTAYRASRVSQGLTGVRTQAEIDLAAKLGAQLISGPGVTALLRAPLGPLPLSLFDLPLRQSRLAKAG